MPLISRSCIWHVRKCESGLDECHFTRLVAAQTSGLPSRKRCRMQKKKKTDAPVPIDAPDIVYTPEDNEAINDFHRMTVTSAGRHSVSYLAFALHASSEAWG
ncbi:hypothetical protein HD554DRAFT_1627880 [Boletus coccyginus]|nr:hypothetical protein HD554DRAFT_1627880 [Boletus coccyginus]